MKISKDDLNYFLHIKAIDVQLFGLNAAAILSIIKAGEIWRIETNHRNKKSNDIAEMHGDKRWLPEDVFVGFTNQDLVNRCFGVCGRNGVVDALKILNGEGVITVYTNPNKNYTSDKGRYFRFHQDVYDRLVMNLKCGSVEGTNDEDDQISQNELSTGENTQVVESYDRLNLNDAPFKNKRQEDGNRLKINAPRLNLNAHIRNSINKEKEINKSINAHENSSITEKPNTGLEAADTIQSIITALTEKGMQSKRFYPDAIAEIRRLRQAGATPDDFIKAYDVANRVTLDRGFGMSYLVKVVEDLMVSSKSPKPRSTSSHSQSKDQFRNVVYESDMSNVDKWIKE